MKDHKLVERDLGMECLEGPIDEVIEWLEDVRRVARDDEGWIELTLSLDPNWCGDANTLMLRGWKAMTTVEKERAKKVAQRKREANARSKVEKELAERKELERLKEKYGEE